MQKEELLTVRIETIAKSHQLMGIAKTRHPLFSILRFEDIAQTSVETRSRLIFDFYQIVLKKDCPGKLKYGQTNYDFDEGVMSFFAPQQVNILDTGDIFPKSGWLLNIHSDFVRTFPLGQKMKNYGFFGYAVNEALILSEEEEQSIDTIFQQIEKEYCLPIDNFSQEVVVSNIELLLTYCNRYYNRQFVLRKPHSEHLLARFDKLLNEYFEGHAGEKGLPSVSYFASGLNLSPKYLSDCLKSITSQNTLQLIHEKLIERAKEKLSATNLTVSEIAYHLGFEHSQSFSKLFKSKTTMTPLEFRKSFN